MEIRQLRYFVAVAEEGSFSRAAERLHISQPPLSQQIKGLEDELNAQLFHRKPRGVTLTAAGTKLLTSARSILSQVRSAAHETSQVAAGMYGTLRMGTVSSALPLVMPAIFKRLVSSIPGIRIELTEMSSHEQAQAVHRDDLDIGLVHTPIDNAELRVRPVFREPLYAVLPKNHSLAQMKSLTVSDLMKEDFVFFPRHLAPGLFDRMVALCMSAGFSPRIHHTARHQSTILQMVAMGLGVTMVPGSLQKVYRNNVCFREITGNRGEVELALIWKASPSEIVRRVLSELQTQDLNASIQQSESSATEP